MFWIGFVSLLIFGTVWKFRQHSLETTGVLLGFLISQNVSLRLRVIMTLGIIFFGPPNGFGVGKGVHFMSRLREGTISVYVGSSHALEKIGCTYSLLSHLLKCEWYLNFCLSPPPPAFPKVIQDQEKVGQETEAESPNSPLDPDADR